MVHVAGGEEGVGVGPTLEHVCASARPFMGREVVLLGYWADVPKGPLGPTFCDVVREMGTNSQNFIRTRIRIKWIYLMLNEYRF